MFIHPGLLGKKPYTKQSGSLAFRGVIVGEQQNMAHRTRKHGQTQLKAGRPRNKSTEFRLCVCHNLLNLLGSVSWSDR